MSDYKRRDYPLPSPQQTQEIVLSTRELQGLIVEALQRKGQLASLGLFEVNGQPVEPVLRVTLFGSIAPISNSQ